MGKLRFTPPFRQLAAFLSYIFAFNSTVPLSWAASARTDTLRSEDVRSSPTDARQRLERAFAGLPHATVPPHGPDAAERLTAFMDEVSNMLGVRVIAQRANLSASRTTPTATETRVQDLVQVIHVWRVDRTPTPRRIIGLRGTEIVGRATASFHPQDTQYWLDRGVADLGLGAATPYTDVPSVYIDATLIPAIRAARAAGTAARSHDGLAYARLTEQPASAKRITEVSLVGGKYAYVQFADGTPIREVPLDTDRVLDYKISATGTSVAFVHRRNGRTTVDIYLAEENRLISNFQASVRVSWVDRLLHRRPLEVRFNEQGQLEVARLYGWLPVELWRRTYSPEGAELNVAVNTPQTPFTETDRVLYDSQLWGLAEVQLANFRAIRALRALRDVQATEPETLTRLQAAGMTEADAEAWMARVTSHLAPAAERIVRLEDPAGERYGKGSAGEAHVRYADGHTKPLFSDATCVRVSRMVFSRDHRAVAVIYQPYGFEWHRLRVMLPDEDPVDIATSPSIKPVFSADSTGIAALCQDGRGRSYVAQKWVGQRSWEPMPTVVERMPQGLPGKLFGRIRFYDHSDSIQVGLWLGWLPGVLIQDARRHAPPASVYARLESKDLPRVGKYFWSYYSLLNATERATVNAMIDPRGFSDDQVANALDVLAAEVVRADSPLSPTERADRVRELRQILGIYTQLAAVYVARAADHGSFPAQTPGTSSAPTYARIGPQERLYIDNALKDQELTNPSDALRETLARARRDLSHVEAVRSIVASGVFGADAVNASSRADALVRAATADVLMAGAQGPRIPLSHTRASILATLQGGELTPSMQFDIVLGLLWTDNQPLSDRLQSLHHLVGEQNPTVIRQAIQALPISADEQTVLMLAFFTPGEGEGTPTDAFTPTSGKVTVDKKRVELTDASGRSHFSLIPEGEADRVRSVSVRGGTSVAVFEPAHRDLKDPRLILRVRFPGQASRDIAVDEVRQVEIQSSGQHVGVIVCREHGGTTWQPLVFAHDLPAPVALHEPQRMNDRPWDRLRGYEPARFKFGDHGEIWLSESGYRRWGRPITFGHAKTFAIQQLAFISILLEYASLPSVRNGELMLQMVDGNILQVTHARPAHIVPTNAWSRQAREDFLRILQQNADHAAVAGTILTGAGSTAFSGGADLFEVAGLNTVEEGQSEIASWVAFLNAIEDSKKPVVAALNGVAVGGGAHIALACHGRVMADTATNYKGAKIPNTWQHRESLGLGFMPPALHRLCRILGPRRTLELFLAQDERGLGRRITADDAHGLVDKVVSADQLEAAAIQRVRELAARDPLSIPGRDWEHTSAAQREEAARLDRDPEVRTWIASCEEHGRGKIARYVLETLQLMYREGVQRANERIIEIGGAALVADGVRQRIRETFLHPANLQLVEREGGETALAEYRHLVDQHLPPTEAAMPAPPGTPPDDGISPERRAIEAQGGVDKIVVLNNGVRGDEPLDSYDHVLRHRLPVTVHRDPTLGDNVTVAYQPIQYGVTNLGSLRVDCGTCDPLVVERHVLDALATSQLPLGVQHAKATEAAQQTLLTRIDSLHQSPAARKTLHTYLRARNRAFARQQFHQQQIAEPLTSSLFTAIEQAATDFGIARLQQEGAAKIGAIDISEHGDLAIAYAVTTAEGERWYVRVYDAQGQQQHIFEVPRGGDPAPVKELRFFRDPKTEPTSDNVTLEIIYADAQRPQHVWRSGVRLHRDQAVPQVQPLSPQFMPDPSPWWMVSGSVELFERALQHAAQIGRARREATKQSQVVGPYIELGLDPEQGHSVTIADIGLTYDPDNFDRVTAFLRATGAEVAFPAVPKSAGRVHEAELPVMMTDGSWGLADLLTYDRAYADDYAAAAAQKTKLEELNAIYSWIKRNGEGWGQQVEAGTWNIQGAAVATRRAVDEQRDGFTWSDKAPREGANGSTVFFFLRHGEMTELIQLPVPVTLLEIYSEPRKLIARTGELEALLRMQTLTPVERFERAVEFLRGAAPGFNTLLQSLRDQIGAPVEQITRQIEALLAALPAETIPNKGLAAELLLVPFQPTSAPQTPSEPQRSATSGSADSAKTFVAVTPIGVGDHAEPLYPAVTAEEREHIDRLVRGSIGASFGGAFGSRQAITFGAGAAPLSEQVKDPALRYRAREAFRFVQEAIEGIGWNAWDAQLGWVDRSRQPGWPADWPHDIKWTDVLARTAWSDSRRVVFIADDDNPALLTSAQLEQHGLRKGLSLIGSSGNWQWRGHTPFSGSHYCKLALIEWARRALGDDGARTFIQAWIIHETLVLARGAYVANDAIDTILNGGVAKILAYTYDMPEIEAHSTLSLERAPQVRDFVQEAARFLGAKRIQLVGPGDEARLIQEAVAAKEVLRERGTNRLFSFSYWLDTARSVLRTFVVSDDERDKGRFTNWRRAKEFLPQVLARMRDAYRGEKTMYVIPYIRDPEADPSTGDFWGVQVTDSRYGALNLIQLYQTGQLALDRIADSGRFRKHIHCTGHLETLVRHEQPSEDDDRFFAVVKAGTQIPGFTMQNLDGVDLLFGSAYGGNLLGPKKMDLRMDMAAGAHAGNWATEHMAVAGLQDLQTSKTTYFAYAAPSQSGKTNMALMELPKGLRERYRWIVVSDDLARWSVVKGEIRVKNPERGMFGVAPDTDWSTNPMLMNAMGEGEQKNTGTLFTNIAVKLAHDPKTDALEVVDHYWESPNTQPPWAAVDAEAANVAKGAMRADEGWYDWRFQLIRNRPAGTRQEPWTHANARATTRLANVPNWIGHAADWVEALRPTDWDHPQGVKLDFVMWGGRRRDTQPLLSIMFDSDSGEYDGAMAAAETTAAELGARGVLGWDPRAQKPFMALREADYFNHMRQLTLAEGERSQMEQTGEAPPVLTHERLQKPLLYAHVNPFRKGADGKYLYGGYALNAHLVEFLVRLVNGDPEAQAQLVQTPTCWVPSAEALAATGTPVADLRQALSVNLIEQQAEMARRSALMTGLPAWMQNVHQRYANAVVSEVRKRAEQAAAGLLRDQDKVLWGPEQAAAAGDPSWKPVSDQKQPYETQRDIHVLQELQQRFAQHGLAWISPDRQAVAEAMKDEQDLAAVRTIRRQHPVPPLMAANWKANAPDAEGYVNSMAHAVGAHTNTDVVLAVPDTVLERVVRLVRASGLPDNVMVGAQDVSVVEKPGAETGQTLAQFIAAAGGKAVVIGHSELRTEIDPVTGRRVRVPAKLSHAAVLQKIRNAIARGLMPILCIGETYAERQLGQTFDVIEEQLHEEYAPLSPEERAKVVLAYEPVWAIGAGQQPATPAQAQEVHRFTRVALCRIAGVEQAARSRILYGGNFSPTNAHVMMSQPDIDGGLVGGASLKAEQFSQLVLAPSQTIKSIESERIGTTPLGYETLRMRIHLADGTVGEWFGLPAGTSAGTGEARTVGLAQVRAYVERIVQRIRQENIPADDLLAIHTRVLVPLNEEVAREPGLNPDELPAGRSPELWGGLGGDTVLCVEMSLALAAAESRGIEPVEFIATLVPGAIPAWAAGAKNHLRGVTATGGEHGWAAELVKKLRIDVWQLFGKVSPSIQEFTVRPIGAASPYEEERMLQRIRRRVAEKLREQGINPGEGKEGGVAPEIMLDAPEARRQLVGSGREMIKLIIEVGGELGFVAGRDFQFHLDAAANSFYRRGKQLAEDTFEEGVYNYDGRERDWRGLLQEYVDLVIEINTTHPGAIGWIEDPFAEFEEQHEAWREGRRVLNSLGVKVVADDLLASRADRARALADLYDEAISKQNQTGSLIENLRYVAALHELGKPRIFSHRSKEAGETYDTSDVTIARLAFRTGADLKTMPVQANRRAKVHEWERLQQRQLALAAVERAQHSFGQPALRQFANWQIETREAAIQRVIALEQTLPPVAPTRDDLEYVCHLLSYTTPGRNRQVSLNAMPPIGADSHVVIRGSVLPFPPVEGQPVLEVLTISAAEQVTPVTILGAILEHGNVPEDVRAAFEDLAITRAPQLVSAAARRARAENLVAPIAALRSAPPRTTPLDAADLSPRERLIRFLAPNAPTVQRILREATARAQAVEALLAEVGLSPDAAFQLVDEVFAVTPAEFDTPPPAIPPAAPLDKAVPALQGAARVIVSDAQVQRLHLQVYVGDEGASVTIVVQAPQGGANLEFTLKRQRDSGDYSYRRFAYGRTNVSQAFGDDLVQEFNDRRCRDATQFLDVVREGLQRTKDSPMWQAWVAEPAVRARVFDQAQTAYTRHPEILEQLEEPTPAPPDGSTTLPSAPFHPSGPELLGQRAETMGAITKMNEGPEVKSAMYAIGTYAPSTKNTVAAASWAGVLRLFHSANVNDQFIPPLVEVDDNGQPVGVVRDGDSVVYWDFRTDRAKPLTAAFIGVPYEGQVGGLSDEATARPHVTMVTMTHYDDNFTAETLPPGQRAREAFNPSEPINDTYSEVIAREGIDQLVVGETEKWRAITWFLNGRKNLGFQEQSYHNNVRTLQHPTLPITVKVVDSREVAEHTKAPQMRAKEITDILLEGVQAGVKDIFNNYANADMVGHASHRPEDFEAVVQTILELDTQLGRLVPAALAQGYTVLITADHGNAEEMFFPNGQINPAHTSNPVPFIVLGLEGHEALSIRPDVSIGDVAPTLAQLRGLTPPASWDRTSALVGPVQERKDRKILRIVLDGYGLRAETFGNAMAEAAKRKGSSLHVDRWMQGKDGAVAAPASASGEANGYPPGTAGTTEFGHVLFDAGRRVGTDQVAIDLAIEKKEFEHNVVLLEALRRVKASGKTLHLMGILSDGRVHASLTHVEALLKLAAQEGLPKKQVAIHVITDGRDVAGESAGQYLTWLEQRIAQYGVGRIVSIWGRGWGKDRTNRWKRIEAAYRSLTEGTAAVHVRLVQTVDELKVIPESLDGETVAQALDDLDFQHITGWGDMEPTPASSNVPILLGADGVGTYDVSMDARVKAGQRLALVRETTTYSPPISRSTQGMRGAYNRIAPVPEPSSEPQRFASLAEAPWLEQRLAEPGAEVREVLPFRNGWTVGRILRDPQYLARVSVSAPEADDSIGIPRDGFAAVLVSPDGGIVYGVPVTTTVAAGQRVGAVRRADRITGDGSTSDLGTSTLRYMVEERREPFVTPSTRSLESLASYRTRSKPTLPEDRWVIADPADGDSIRPLLASHNVFCHLAGAVGLRDDQQVDDVAANALLALKVIQEAEAVNPTIRFVFPSTRLVYDVEHQEAVEAWTRQALGFLDRHEAELRQARTFEQLRALSEALLRELPLPARAYPLAKLLVERHLAKGRLTNYVVLRIASSYGAGSLANRRIQTLLAARLRGETLVVPPEELDYVHVDDLAPILYQAGVQKGLARSTRDVASGTLISTEHVRDLIVRETPEATGTIRIEGVPYQGPRQDPQWCQSALGRPFRSFDEGLIEQVRAARARFALERALRKPFELVIADLEGSLTPARRAKDQAVEKLALEPDTAALIGDLRRRGMHLAPITTLNLADANARYADRLSVADRAGQFLCVDGGGTGFRFDMRGEVDEAAPVFSSPIVEDAASLDHLTAAIKAGRDAAGKERAGSFQIVNKPQDRPATVSVRMRETPVELREQVAEAIRRQLAAESRYAGVEVLVGSNAVQVTRGKGGAVRHIVEYLGIDPSKVLIIGDGAIDAAMFNALPGATKLYLGEVPYPGMPSDVIHSPIPETAGARQALSLVLEAHVEQEASRSALTEAQRFAQKLGVVSYDEVDYRKLWQQTGKPLLVTINMDSFENDRLKDPTKLDAALDQLEAIAGDIPLDIVSHNGRPQSKGPWGYSMEAAAEEIQRRWPHRKVIWAGGLTGPEVEANVKALKPGQVLVRENFRFDSRAESDVTEERQALPREIVYGLTGTEPMQSGLLQNDFASAPRFTKPSPSTRLVDLPTLLPSVAGPLLLHELERLEPVRTVSRHPFVAIFAGAKVGDKIQEMGNVVEKMAAGDTLAVAGKMAFTFMLASAQLDGRVVNLGKSEVDTEFLEETKKVILAARKQGVRYIEPIDHVVTDNVKNPSLIRTADGPNIGDGLVGVDVGRNTVDLIKQALGSCALFYWNGTLGVFEDERFAQATYEIAKAGIDAVKRGALGFPGGGDTLAAIAKARKAGIIEGQFTHESTGGGSSAQVAGVAKGKHWAPVEALRQAAPRTRASLPLVQQEADRLAEERRSLNAQLTQLRLEQQQGAADPADDRQVRILTVEETLQRNAQAIATLCWRHPEFSSRFEMKSAPVQRTTTARLTMADIEQLERDVVLDTHTVSRSLEHNPSTVQPAGAKDVFVLLWYDQWSSKASARVVVYYPPTSDVTSPRLAKQILRALIDYQVAADVPRSIRTLYEGLRRRAIALASAKAPHLLPSQPITARMGEPRLAGSDAVGTAYPEREAAADWGAASHVLTRIEALTDGATPRIRDGLPPPPSTGSSTAGQQLTMGDILGLAERLTVDEADEFLYVQVAEQRSPPIHDVDVKSFAERLGPHSTVVFINYPSSIPSDVLPEQIMRTVLNTAAALPQKVRDGFIALAKEKTPKLLEATSAGRAAELASTEPRQSPTLDEALASGAVTARSP